MRTCPSCGGSSPPDARWCGQCFRALAHEAPARPEPVAAGSRFGLSASTATALAAPPVAVPAPEPAPSAVGRRGDRGPMLGHRAVALVALAIGIGAVGMALSWGLGHDESLEPEAYIRYAIVIVIGVYAVVGALIVTQLAPGVRLRWTTGSPASGIVIGAAVGGGLSAALLFAVSAAAGHLSPDPRIVTMMSEGDAAHLVVSALIACVCAPLVEEVLFRGLLLESLRTYGAPVAIIGSGVAFAIWHLNPSALRYYALVGALLGVLYLKRGLVCSMAAHAAFNGVLTVAALAVVLAPAKMVVSGHVSLRAPGGWSSAQNGAGGIALEGPSGASVLVVQVPTVDVPSTDTVIRRLRSGVLAQTFPGLVVDAGSTRKVELPAGPAVEVDVTAEGHRGTIVFLPLAGESLDVVFVGAGSMKAQSDFPKILDSLRVG